MSYCVYVLLNPGEDVAIQAFLDNEEVQKIFKNRFPKFMGMPETKDLPYMAEAHKGLPHIGYHYSLGFEEAHTFCLWLAQTLGKPGYFYDGDEEYEAPMHKKVVVPASTWLSRLLTQKLRKNLEKFVDELTSQWHIMENKSPGFPASKIKS